MSGVRSSPVIVFSTSLYTWPSTQATKSPPSFMRLRARERAAVVVGVKRSPALAYRVEERFDDEAGCWPRCKRTFPAPSAPESSGGR